MAFCNERLAGTLDATVIVDGPTARDLGPAYDAALAGLRYGSVAVNIWSADRVRLRIHDLGGLSRAHPGGTSAAAWASCTTPAWWTGRRRRYPRAPSPCSPSRRGSSPTATRIASLSRSAVLDADPHWWRLPASGSGRCWGEPDRPARRAPGPSARDGRLSRAPPSGATPSCWRRPTRSWRAPRRWPGTSRWRCARRGSPRWSG